MQVLTVSSPQGSTSWCTTAYMIVILAPMKDVNNLIFRFYAFKAKPVHRQMYI